MPMTKKAAKQLRELRAKIRKAKPAFDEAQAAMLEARMAFSKIEQKIRDLEWKIMDIKALAKFGKTPVCCACRKRKAIPKTSRSFGAGRYCKPCSMRVK